MRNIVAIAILIWSTTGPCDAGTGQTVPHVSSTLVIEDYDQPRSSALPAKLRLVGPAALKSGKHGDMLELKDASHAEVELQDKLYGSSGTISFWVKPFWKSGDLNSHTLASIAWSDGRNGYMAISQGWWEPLGSKRFYFILNNQDFVHCSVPYALPPEWSTMVTAVWKDGTDGYCKLYIDGIKVAGSKKSFDGGYRSQGPLFLGSDQAASNQRGRTANAMIDLVRIYNLPLSDIEVHDAYVRERSKPTNARVRQREWVNEIIGTAGSREPRRTIDGLLLESRVIFDEVQTWATSKRATDEIIQRISTAGFNVYVPIVWHGRGTLYPSALAPPEVRMKKLIESGHDPLAYLIEKAHAKGIEVHPWFTVARRELDFLNPEFYEQGTPATAFNVHDKGFRKFIVDLMIDLTKRYDVDGVNLDYIRSIGVCTTTRCKDEYNAKYGRSLLFDMMLQEIPGKRVKSLEEWNSAAITDIVRSFSTRAKAAKPDLIVSVDSAPWAHHLTEQGHNSIEWANNGWVDVIFGMDYERRPRIEHENIARSQLKNPDRFITIFSTYDILDKKVVIHREPTLISDYVRVARALWPGGGVAFYHYLQLTDEQVKELSLSVFSEPATPTWRTDKTVLGTER